MHDFEEILLSRLDQIIISLPSQLGWLQNTISAVFGVVIGSVISYVTQKAGRLKILSGNTSLSIHDYSDFRNENLKVDLLTIDLDIDLHNNSNSYKGMREVRLLIQDEKKRKHYYTLLDRDTYRQDHFSSHYDEIEVINVEPNSMMRINAKCYIRNSELFLNHKSIAIKIQYRNHYNRKKNNIIKKFRMYNFFQEEKLKYDKAKEERFKRKW